MCIKVELKRHRRGLVWGSAGIKWVVNDITQRVKRGDFVGVVSHRLGRVLSSL